MKIDNKEELFPIVDVNGNVIGSAPRGECHNGSMLLHPVVHLHVFNGKGELYLQRRPDWKDIQPGKWDTAVGGHVDFGESVRQALMREANEELGLLDFKPKALEAYIFQSDRERELVNPFYAISQDSQIHPSEELDGGKFWAIDDIKEHMGKGVFTPNFESEFKLLSLDKILAYGNS